MATTNYTPSVRLALPTAGDLDGTWGAEVNDNITTFTDQAIAGMVTINVWTGNTHVLTANSGSADEARYAILKLVAGGGLPNAAATLICPTSVTKPYIVNNGTGQTVTIKTSGGTGIPCPTGYGVQVYCDGTNVLLSGTYLQTPSILAPIIVLGTINNTPIGATLPTTGNFTNIGATGNIIATSIGVTTRGIGKFTTLEANGLLTATGGIKSPGAGADSFRAGTNAGVTTQGSNAVAVGKLAGNDTQGDGAVAIGLSAGTTNQRDNNIAIGYEAGESEQKEICIAIGYRAGKTSQGAGAVAIGQLAGETSQGIRSLVINASGIAQTAATGGVNISSGSAYLRYSSGSWGANTAISNDSDETLKKNIELIPDALDKVNALRGVTFDWIDEDRDDQGKQTGLIAQDLQKVLPEVVKVTEENILAVQYGPIVGLLVESIKELTARVEALEG